MHVGPAGVDGRDVGADGVDPLHTLAGGHVLEDEVRRDEREHRVDIASEEGVPVAESGLDTASGFATSRRARTAILSRAR
jgi:hypothetical protein